MSTEITFFLVDDNDIDIAVNSKLLALSGAGEKVISFSGARKFLDYLAENADGILTHRCVLLLDIMMPNMNGFECVEAFAFLPEEIKKNFTIFMLSSTIDRNDIKRAESTGLVKRVLEKPLDIYLLKKLLADL
jgi:CheY-like chemotaxis protein